MFSQVHGRIARSVVRKRATRVTPKQSPSPPPFIALSGLALPREHGHGLSVGLNTSEDDAEVSDAKDQNPAGHDEKIYPVVVLSALPEFACIHTRMHVCELTNGLRQST